MWLHRCLENVKACSGLGIGVNHSTVCSCWRRHIAHKRNHIAKELHKTANTHVLACANAEHRQNILANQTLADTHTHLILTQRAVLKILVHQPLIMLSGSLHKCVVHLSGLILVLSRNLRNLRHTALWFPLIHLHEQHVNKGVELRTLVDRELDRHHLAAVVILQALQAKLKVSLVRIKLVNNKNARLLHLLYLAELVLCTHFHTLSGVNKHKSSVCYAERCNHTTHKIIGARAINKVQLLSKPLHMQHSWEN